MLAWGLLSGGLVCGQGVVWVSKERVGGSDEHTEPDFVRFCEAETFC